MIFIPIFLASIGARNKKILVVEDNIETQLIFKIHLREFYDINIVETAEKGLSEIKKGEYDLLLLDINLPGKLDGNDVLRELRISNEYKTLPIVVVTAYALKGDKGKFIDMGASDYITKPIEKEKLLNSIKMLI